MESEKFWFEEFDNFVEINPRDNCQIKVNVGQKEDCVVIDKLYGPHMGEDVRVSFNKDYDWVVERLNLTTNEWEVKAQWYMQETFTPEDE